MLRICTSCYLEDQIVWVSNSILWLKNKINCNLLLSILHSSKHISIFSCNCSNTYFWICFIVMHNTSMHRFNRIWSYWTNKSSNSAIFSSIWCSLRSISNGLTIICPRFIIYYYFSFDLVLNRIKFIPICNNNYLSWHIASNTPT